MSSVLLSFRLSMLATDQALISLIHYYLMSRNVCICSICNCKLSANEWSVMGCESIMVDKGLVCMNKNIDPRTEPCGTPIFTGAKSEQ